LLRPAGADDRAGNTVLGERPCGRHLGDRAAELVGERAQAFDGASFVGSAVFGTHAEDGDQVVATRELMNQL
jgi:hypothetical protein